MQPQSAGYYNSLNIFSAYIFKVLHLKRMIFKGLWDLDNIQHDKSNLTKVHIIKSCGVHSLATLNQTGSQEKRDNRNTSESLEIKKHLK